MNKRVQFVLAKVQQNRIQILQKDQEIHLHHQTPHHN